MPLSHQPFAACISRKQQQTEFLITFYHTCDFISIYLQEKPGFALPSMVDAPIF